MGKNTKAQRQDKTEKINFYEKVAEARVEQIVEEERELANTDPKILHLVLATNDSLRRMAELAQQAAEETEQVYAEAFLAERREIRNEIIVDNIRLVTQVLKKYGYFNPDKFQNGCIGLLKAAETFDTTKGVPFSSYAAFCVESEVRMAFKRVNRMFESKKKGYLESLDAMTSGAEGDRQQEKYEQIGDDFVAMEFDEIISEAEVDTLFYDIIIPVVEEYGKRAKDIDMEQWKSLEIQYFLELSMEQSQRQRITFTEMANQLNTTAQNIRARHKKVMSLVKEACVEYGYSWRKTVTGRVVFWHEDFDQPVHYRGKKHK